MARALRQTAPGLVHHIVNRGNRKKPIFYTPGDYRAFFAILAESVSRFSMRLLAYCLMRNHWHLVLWPDERVTISEYMHWLTTVHVRQYHLHYNLTGTGHLYQARFRNRVCREARGVLGVIRYVEGNPLAAGIVHRAEDWKWSSLWLRTRGDERGVLASGPVALPANWAKYVNESTLKKTPACELERKGHRSFMYTPDPTHFKTA